VPPAVLKRLVLVFFVSGASIAVWSGLDYVAAASRQNLVQDAEDLSQLVHPLEPIGEPLVEEMIPRGGDEAGRHQARDDRSVGLERGYARSPRGLGLSPLQAWARAETGKEREAAATLAVVRPRLRLPRLLG
jgi:hypothetical protein